ncbi:B70 [miniopterid betaherpesvirus 1]|uniref:B70 n=1 Tax=miniopterid betaherpesvirus 1 TaxID=3070189 RepID=I3VQ63_9BETA|nr:B70 [miniopterid betaherpesvirus 1]AFK83907.1 B70 [miniopterid betaherpesvirus 1]
MTTVVFATEYDAANIVIGILTRSPTEHHVYPLLIKYRPSRNIEFCLQTQKCNNSKRISTIFICDDTRLQLSQRLSETGSIPSSALSESLDEERTKSIYQHLLRPVTQPGINREITEFHHLAFFNKNAIIRYLNTTFLAPTSPSWFMSTFGSTEGMLLLSMSYYLLEEQYSTIQTTRDYVRCFCHNTGRPILAYVSMSEFSTVLQTSLFRLQMSRFATYAKSRNARDRAELEYVDNRIDTFRQRALLPDAACVHYIYLAYRTALCRDRILRYCDTVAYDPTRGDDQCTDEPFQLGRLLSNDLISIMEKYFSSVAFFREYVEYEFVSSAEVGRCAGYRYDAQAESPVGFFGSAASLTNALRRLNDVTDGMFSPVDPSVSGALVVCASDRRPPVVEHNSTGAEVSVGVKNDTRERPAPATRREYLLHAREMNQISGPPNGGPFPMFRLELADGKHLFCILRGECWHKAMMLDNALRYVPEGYVSDEAVTDALWLGEDRTTTQNYVTQLYRTRHEIFNERLPVHNFIGDLDLRLRDGVPSPSRESFFNICRGIRRVILALWTTIFKDIDPDTHPVYFFKTACSVSATYANDPDGFPSDLDITPAKFCNCTDKLGLRVISPFPRGTAAFGGTVMRTLAKILNHAMCLDEELVRILDTIAHPGDCFDTGIYNACRSIRMPLMYKVDREAGRLMYGRLLPIFIVPPGYRREAKTFVAQQLDIRNLMHHHPPVHDERSDDRLSIDRLLVKLRDKACPDPSSGFIDSRSAKVSRYPRTALTAIVILHLQARGRPARESDALSSRAASAASAWASEASDPLGYEDDAPRIRPLDTADLCRVEWGEKISYSVPDDDMRWFVENVAWPPILHQITAHYDQRASVQFNDRLIFDVSNPNCIAVKRLVGGRVKDFRCLAKDHRNQQETVQVFLDLRGGHQNTLWVTLWSRCFTTKCNSNSKQVHASCHVKPPTQF